MIDLANIKLAALPDVFRKERVTKCEPCNGLGFVVTFKYQNSNTLETIHCCEHCNGTGYTIKDSPLTP